LEPPTSGSGTKETSKAKVCLFQEKKHIPQLPQKGVGTSLHKRNFDGSLVRHHLDPND